MSKEDRTTTHEELFGERLAIAAKCLEDGAERIRRYGPGYGTDHARLQDAMSATASATLNAIQSLGNALVRIETATYSGQLPGQPLTTEEWAAVASALEAAEDWLRPENPTDLAACRKLREQIMGQGQPNGEG